MATLTPTVHERLARCGTAIYVDGVQTGAHVLISVDGTDYSQVATGGAVTFTVPPLNAGASVVAAQDAGDGFSPFSPAVIVESAHVPPNTAPNFPNDVGICSQCVPLDGLVPGCTVELSVDGTPVGTGTAGLDGTVCAHVDFSLAKEGMTLSARMVLCGQPGADAGTPLVQEPLLLRPVVGDPLFGCQTAVPLSNLHVGARVRLETDTIGLGTFCSCWEEVIEIGSPLVTDSKVRAQQYWDVSCQATGPWSMWEPVVAPDGRIKPKVLDPLIDGDQVIRVDNQIPGASLVIRIRPAVNQSLAEFGPRPASDMLEIALNAPLDAGNVVTVVQTLCAFSMESDPVTVQPRPPVLLAPVVVPPLFACARAVQVSNVFPGAMVRIYEDGYPVGQRWAGEETSLRIDTAPFLVAGGKVTAHQWVGGTPSPMSWPPVQVEAANAMHTPRILEPVANADTVVCVSGVTPGAQVAILVNGQVIGQLNAAESFVRVPVAGVGGAVTAATRLCELSASSVPVSPITQPYADGIFVSVGEDYRSYGVWIVPVTTDGPVPFQMKVEGQLYYPGTNGLHFDSKARNLPLVIIAHGYWDIGMNSYLGYDYLAKQLARWGMVVFSINLDVVNSYTNQQDTNQYTRGEIILHVIDALAGDPSLQGLINQQNVGLIGHSMGGEGVVAAQFLNESQGRGYGINGVVSIAPTHWRPELVLRQTKYAQLLGSMDQLLSLKGAVTGTSGVHSGFRIYDRAWRPKTHFYIHKARHNAFNRQWVANGDNFETNIAALALPPQDHERIAMCLINAFFQDALLGQSQYAGYMGGTILPNNLLDLTIHTQHSEPPTQVLDNFGDPDEQTGLPAAPLDKTVNSRNQMVDAAGAGLDLWQDVAHVTLANSPHDTKSVELSWNQPALVYSSPTGGLGVGTTDSLALRISQFFKDDALNPVAEPVDLFVSVSDGANQAMVRLGAVSQVPYPETNGLSVFKTVRLPLDAFTAVNPALNPANIQSVRLVLMGRGTGHILVDDLELGG